MVGTDTAGGAWLDTGGGTWMRGSTDTVEGAWLSGPSEERCEETAGETTLSCSLTSCGF